MVDSTGALAASRSLRNLSSFALDAAASGRCRPAAFHDPTAGHAGGCFRHQLYHRVLPHQRAGEHGPREGQNAVTKADLTPTCGCWPIRMDRDLSSEGRRPVSVFLTAFRLG